MTLRGDCLWLFCFSRVATWRKNGWNRYTRAGLNVRTGTRFIKGRQFYSRTRSRATDIALDAADALLSRIAEEKG